MSSSTSLPQPAPNGNTPVIVDVVDLPGLPAPIPNRAALAARQREIALEQMDTWAAHRPDAFYFARMELASQGGERAWIWPFRRTLGARSRGATHWAVRMSAPAPLPPLGYIEVGRLPGDFTVYVPDETGAFLGTHELEAIG